MSMIGARLGVLWAQWKYVAILLALLAGSAWLNLHLYVALKEAPLKIELAGKDEALSNSAALLASTQERAHVLATAADRATANLNASSDDYRSAARARPLPANCAPGQARVGAVNRALGASVEKVK
jgi:hypothetical protein